MEYKAGDIVRLRSGEQVTLEDYTGSDDFPLRFEASEAFDGFAV